MSQASCKSRYGVRYLQKNNQGPRDPEKGTYAMKRILPSRKMRQEVEEVLSGCETEGHPLDKFVSLGASICFR